MFSNLSTIGKYLFLVPFLVFGVQHLIKPDAMVSTVPVPGGILWVYVTGIAMLAFVASVLIGKYDKLAAVLLAVMITFFILLMDIPVYLKDQTIIAAFMKNIGFVGGALMYAGALSRDNRIIG